MRRIVSVLLVSLAGCGFAAFAQQPVGTPSFDEQQITSIFNGIAQHSARLAPMLEQLKPGDWVAKGAPDTYVSQLARALDEMHGIEADMSALARRPDQMTDAMKALFRTQAAHQRIASLMGGLRKYQNPALADLIEAVAAEDQGEIAQLQQYLLELVTEKEQQFKVVDAEAQRCRGTLSRQSCPPAPLPSTRPPVRKPAPAPTPAQ